MRRIRALPLWLACLAWLAWFGCLQARAAPPLKVPHGRLGQAGESAGPAAVWRGAGGAFLIHTRSDPAKASGTVQRRALRIGLDGEPGVAPDPVWDAGAMLGGEQGAAPAPAPEERNIFSIDAQARTVPFTWTGLDPHWQALLDAPGQGAVADGLGEARTGFLRGERGREAGQPGGVFRRRTGVLGDTVHSVPLIVGGPAASAPGAGAAQYAAFRAQYRQRRMAVYLGANDGMLHAFAADTGSELFAYVPRALAHSLAQLGSPAYQARPYVDASAGQGEAQLNGRWRSVLASGMGMGARGLFALDITNPEQFGAEAGALWEFTDQDDPALGHVHAAPLIARLRSGTARKPMYRHVVLASSGINPLADDGNGVLFLLSLDKPAAQAWQAGLNYESIATGGADAALPNALAPPALAIRNDGSASHAYAGDLQGNLWRFDLAARTAHRLFTARDRAGQAQPIAHAPAVVFAPGGGFLVLFGTGKLLEEADLHKPSFMPQSLYAIHDKLDAAPGPIDSRAQLAARTLSGKGSYTISGEPLDYFAPDAKRGWYLDFPHARSDGERAAGSPAALAGAILFETLLFDRAGAAPAATRLYVIDALSGFALNPDGTAQPGAASGALMPAGALAPLLVASSAVSAGARSPTGAVNVTRTVTLLPARGGAGAVRIKIRYPAARMGWREVANWPELHARTREKQ